MTGYEVVAALRHDAQLSNTPVVLLTAMSDRKHMRQGMTAGADDYLTKPYRPDELCEAVKAVLQRRQSQQEAFLSSMTSVVEDALMEQKEHLGRRYEQQLAQEVNARWTQKADDKGDLHYPSAVLLQANLLGSSMPANEEGLAERLKRTHQQARDTLYLFGASHVLPYGPDVLAVFAGDDASVTTPVEVRAARAALALVKASAGVPVAIGLHTGPVRLVALEDGLHGAHGHSVVPGESLTSVQALRDQARQADWRIAGSPGLLSVLAETVQAGRTAQTGRGDEAVELCPLSQA